jgi:hypothetical protein
MLETANTTWSVDVLRYVSSVAGMVVSYPRPLGEISFLLVCHSHDHDRE